MYSKYTQFIGYWEKNSDCKPSKAKGWRVQVVACQLYTAGKIHLVKVGLPHTRAWISLCGIKIRPQYVIRSRSDFDFSGNCCARCAAKWNQTITPLQNYDAASNHQESDRRFG